MAEFFSGFFVGIGVMLIIGSCLGKANSQIKQFSSEVIGYDRKGKDK